ncbi:MAG TPA: alpha/beta hydrolase [Anaerolineales bacterium]
MEPALIKGGLAFFKAGQGVPLLLMPYPHGYTLRPIAESPLANCLVGIDRQVITFDPPGSYRSSRPARLDMAEMLQGAQETLETLQINDPVDLAGHSMGGLCALAFALEYPQRVRRLVLIGSVAGGPSIQRCKGMPWNWRWTEPDFWRFVVWGARLALGYGDLALHKRMVQLIRRVSLHDKSLALEIPIEPEDHQRPAPARDRWPLVARRLDYSHRLGAVHATTLICVGRHDPQAPVPCSQKLAQGIPEARLVIFEASGHYPFLEEPELFNEELESFFQ